MSDIKIDDLSLYIAKDQPNEHGTLSDVYHFTNLVDMTLLSYDIPHSISKQIANLGEQLEADALKEFDEYYKEKQGD